VQIKNATMQITPRQLQVLKAIARFENSTCYSATIAELAQELNVSRPTVFEHIAALRRKNLLGGQRHKARSLRLTPQASRLLETSARPQCHLLTEHIIHDNTATLNIHGRVAAGVPVEAVENKEALSLNSMFGGGKDIFALEVVGDSMIDEGITGGDYVICRRTSTAHNGQLVVALLDNENATLKKFYKEPRRVRLQPANDAYGPIYSDNCRIQAVVVGLVRRLAH